MPSETLGQKIPASHLQRHSVTESCHFLRQCFWAYRLLGGSSNTTGVLPFHKHLRCTRTDCSLPQGIDERRCLKLCGWCDVGAWRRPRPGSQRCAAPRSGLCAERRPLPAGTRPLGLETSGGAAQLWRPSRGDSSLSRPGALRARQNAGSESWLRWLLPPLVGMLREDMLSAELQVSLLPVCSLAAVLHSLSLLHAVLRTPKLSPEPAGRDFDGISKLTSST